MPRILLALTHPLFMDELAKCFVQHIVDFVHAKLFLEVADGSIFVDTDHFDTCNLSIVFPIFCCQIIREARMMCSTCQDPCAAPTSKLGIGIHRAEATGNLGNGFGSMHSTSFTIRRKRLPKSTTVAVQPEPTFEVNTRRAVWLLRIPMPRKCTSRRGLEAAIRGQNFQHM